MPAGSERSGQEIAEFVLQAVQEKIAKACTFDEVCAPFAQAVQATRITDQEFDRFVEEMRGEVWREKQGQGRQVQSKYSPGFELMRGGRASQLSGGGMIVYASTMDKPSALAGWTPEQIAFGKRWVETWKLAGVDLERIRRQEIRQLDTYRTIALLCGPADYTYPPRAPKPTSGLVEQQRWFMKAAGRDRGDSGRL